MPKKLPNAVITRARTLWLLGGAIALLAATGTASAESLSARVRACAAESDSLRRLVCYEKNVAPFADTAAAAEAQRDATLAPVQQDVKANAAAQTTVQNSAAQKDSRHITARVVSVDSEHGEMVVHLDNGQAWVQVQEPTAEMNLHAGDTVTVDKRSLMGSYWLGGRTAGVMKVRLKD